MITKTPYLYILMRTDLASMNPGKAVAQGAHAANMFQTAIDKMCKTSYEDEEFAREQVWMYNAWACAGGGSFGTTITLAVDEKNMKRTVLAAKQMGFMADVTHDPTYPLRDGSVTHCIPLDTCAYVFGDSLDLKVLLGNFDLMA